ncbi:hypothetical protein GCM10023161_45410 [Mycobacterium paraffinicum]|uniref:Uncharacterized protein n=1 Tax=Mycobacterium paraffinicum TaxID=53378 RepID=A0ABP8F4X2_9MYCO
MAAAGTVASAKPQLTHGHTLRPLPLPPHAGPAAVEVPLPTERLDSSAFIPEFLPAARLVQTGRPVRTAGPADPTPQVMRSTGGVTARQPTPRCITIVSDIS